MSGIVASGLPYHVKLGGSDPAIYSRIHAAFTVPGEAMAFAKHLNHETGKPVRVLDTRMTTGSLVVARFPE